MDKVLFRMDKEGDVFALFPEIPGASGLCTSYQHVGQHGSADYNWCIDQSRPATESEYLDLYNDLKEIGYDLKVYSRRPSR